MREGDREWRDFVRDKSPSDDWQAFAAGPLAPLPDSRSATLSRRRRRWLVALASAAAVVITGTWLRSSEPSPAAPGAPTWNIELASTGSRSVTALVFGEEAGVHIVRVPAAGGSPDARRRVPVRPSQGSVYLMSLGLDELDVSTTAPPGNQPIALSAQSRFVKLLRTTRTTTIRTGWW